MWHLEPIQTHKEKNMKTMNTKFYIHQRFMQRYCLSRQVTSHIDLIE